MMRQTLMCQQAGGSSSVQALILMAVVGLGAIAGVRVLGQAVDTRAKCAAERIRTLGLGAGQCGEGALAESSVAPPAVHSLPQGSGDPNLQPIPERAFRYVAVAEVAEPEPADNPNPWGSIWEVGGDIADGVGDFLSDVGNWVSHNSDALLDIAVDLAEMAGGAAAVYGGASMVVAGVTSCAASTPLAATGVGALVTGGVCWGGLATAAGGVALVGAGIAMMAHGASNLGDDIGRLENPRDGGGAGPSGTPEPDNPKLRDDRWLRQHGIDPHEVKDELPGRGGYQDIYVDRNGNIYAVRKGTDPNDGEYIGHVSDFQD